MKAVCSDLPGRPSNASNTVEGMDPCAIRKLKLLVLDLSRLLLSFFGSSFCCSSSFFIQNVEPPILDSGAT